MEIPVTKAFLPEFKEYEKFLKTIWKNNWVTNRGPLVLELEKKVRKQLSTTNILITNNGTVPIQIALKLFGKNGEIITTPFSYVATTSAIIWENCKPVFVDIDPKYLTIDETQIEKAITKRTKAILATHVFGNPCNIEVITKIAKKHKLKVIFDAAHCFGVKYKGRSIFNYGDISTCSFHATKIFHTGEGGAIFSKDKELMKKIFQSHNFGHKGNLDFFGLGINGKISELQAAMGLSILPSFKKILKERKKVTQFYNENLNFDQLHKINIRKKTEWNHSYYPVIFKTEKLLLKVEKELVSHNIIPRRYFYPSLNTIKYVNGGKMKISENISSRILCLPIYVGLKSKELNNICRIINRTNK